jgi:hypothetical protein
MSRPLEQQIIERARALIGAPETWTQSEFARDAQGDPVSWRSPKAVRFCIWGALNRAAFEITDDKRQSVSMAERAAAALRGRVASLSRVNDCGTHSEVLALIDTYLKIAALS